jgi:hypothetical protein
MRRMALISLVAVAVFAACGGSSATQQPGAGGNATSAAGGNATSAAKATPTKGQVSGSGSVTVTMGGSSYTVKGGDCAPGIGGNYFVAEAGDWIDGNDPNATADFVSIMIYPDGHAEHGGGLVSGIRFYLNTDDQKGTGDVNTGGTFSGTDAYGHGAVSGTFTCK